MEDEPEHPNKGDGVMTLRFWPPWLPPRLIKPLSERARKKMGEDENARIWNTFFGFGKRQEANA